MLHYNNSLIMSLFKLKNLWINSYSSQQFDQRHLAIGTINEQPALALGSFAGSLRVHLVDSKQQFNVTMIYETTFDAPIISVQFVNHPEYTRNTIGVLVFRKFHYLTLHRNRETNTYQAKSTQISVEPAFAIERSTLSLFSINSSIQYLNPPSIQSIKVSDPIYPFVREEHRLYYGDGEQLVMVQNSVEQWRIVVGPMRDLYLWKQNVLAIGDNAIWEIQESHILKTKILEQDVSCGTVINKGEDYNVLIANFANQIFIFNNDFVLIWAIKANEVPIRISIFQHPLLLGALAILGEEGSISISYLGSEVPETQLEDISQDVNMQEVQEETNKMMATLKTKEQGQKNTQSQQNSSSGNLKVSLLARTPKRDRHPSVDNSSSLLQVDGELWCCEIQCLIKTERQTVYDVTITVRTPSNITCLRNDAKFASIKGSEKYEFTLLCSCEKFPYDNNVEVIVRYQSGEKRKGTSVTTAVCELPFDFQCSFKSLQLEEKPANKIVFKAQNNLPALSQIFPEFQKSVSNSKNLTIALPNGVLCSMGYNKNNTKVKVESSLFSGLCFMFVVFNSRFQKLIKEKKISANQLSIDDIPLEQFFTLMKDHFGLRLILKQKHEQLEKKCEQFRSAQKKLIIKMKEKVSSINNMDKLLEYTYQKLIDAADALEQTRQEMDSVSHNLQISIKFVLELLFMKTKATLKCRQKVQGIIGYQKECMEFGWEQKILANSSHLLNKKFNFAVDKYTFDQLYKTALWVISKINSGEWNQ